MMLGSGDRKPWCMFKLTWSLGHYSWSHAGRHDRPGKYWLFWGCDSSLCLVDNHSSSFEPEDRTPSMRAMSFGVSFLLAALSVSCCLLGVVGSWFRVWLLFCLDCHSIEVVASRITLAELDSIGGRGHGGEQNVSDYGSAINRCHVPPHLVESY